MGHNVLPYSYFLSANTIARILYRLRKGQRLNAFFVCLFCFVLFCFVVCVCVCGCVCVCVCVCACLQGQGSYLWEFHSFVSFSFSSRLTFLLFHQQVDKWERTLSLILEVVEMILTVQRQWMYLEVWPVNYKQLIKYFMYDHNTVHL